MAQAVNKKAKGCRVLLSALEFDMTYRVRELRIKKGFSPEDLSFLLGYNRNFVREIEDPTNKKCYDISLLNYLPKLLDCRLQKLIANRLPGNDYILINVKKWVQQNKIRYVVEQLTGKDSQKEAIKFKFEDDQPTPKKGRKDKKIDSKKRKRGRPKKGKKISTALSINKEETDIQKFISDLFEGNFFNEPKTPFHIFNYCRDAIGKKTQCKYVEKALSTFTGKKKYPKLKRIKNSEARWVYVKIEK